MTIPPKGCRCILTAALLLDASMSLTPSYATKVQKHELARVGAFLVIEEVGEKDGGRYRYAIQTTSALENRNEKADLLLACIQMLPSLRIRFPRARQTREKIFAITKVGNQRPVVDDWLVFPDFESGNAIRIASPLIGRRVFGIS